MASPDRRFALVTGANRGIGLEVVRQLAREGFTTVLGARDLDKGSAAAAALDGEGLDVEARRLDVADSESVRELSAGLDRDLGRLDVLVNNAAIHYDTWQRGSTRTWAWFRRRSTPTCWALGGRPRPVFRCCAAPSTGAS